MMARAFARGNELVLKRRRPSRSSNDGRIRRVRLYCSLDDMRLIALLHTDASWAGSRRLWRHSSQSIPLFNSANRPSGITRLLGFPRTVPIPHIPQPWTGAEAFAGVALPAGNPGRVAPSLTLSRNNARIPGIRD